MAIDITRQLIAEKGKNYTCILSDPPWKFRTFSNKGQGRSPERHYKTMTLEEIAALPVADVAAKDCFLFMWITGPRLVLGQHLRVFDAWGFKPSSIGFVWCKLNKAGADSLFLEEVDAFLGMGYGTRQNVEFCLLARRGKPERMSKKVRQVMFAQRRQHSRKPDMQYPRIEDFCGGPRLEMFARTKRPDWAWCGNETGKFKS